MSEQKSLDEVVPEVTEAMAAKNLSNCIFIFIIQLGIIYLMFSKEPYDEFKVYTADFEYFLARVVCAILLHMQMEGEVRRALSLFNCARINIPHNSNSRFPMLLVAILQLTSGVLVESFNIFIICKQESI